MYNVRQVSGHVYVYNVRQVSGHVYVYNVRQVSGHVYVYNVRQVRGQVYVHSVRQLVVMYMCIRGVYIASVSTIFRLYFGIVPKGAMFLFFTLSMYILTKPSRASFTYQMPNNIYAASVSTMF